MADSGKNKIDSYETVCGVIEYVNEKAYETDAVYFGICYSRPASRQFLNDNNYLEEDVIYWLANLRVSDYSHTSQIPGKQDAYVFGIKDAYNNDFMIYLKFQIFKGIIILSIHKPERELLFPYKEESS